jgi:uncharacterized protein YPO0396
MSKKTNAQLEELLGQAEARIDALSEDLDKANDKLKRKIADYKKKLKAAAVKANAEREAGYTAAVESSDNLKKVAKQEYRKLMQEDLSNLGVPGQVANTAKKELLEKLFGGL